MTVPELRLPRRPAKPTFHLSCLGIIVICHLVFGRHRQPRHATDLSQLVCSLCAGKRCPKLSSCCRVRLEAAMGCCVPSGGKGTLTGATRCKMTSSSRLRQFHLQDSNDILWPTLRQPFCACALCFNALENECLCLMWQNGK